MACLFGHKWEGCTCRKCGKTRDMQHDFQPVPDRCEEKCSRCGKTRPRDHKFSLMKDRCFEKCERCGELREKHEYKNGFCVRCGRQSDRPFELYDLTPQEKDATLNALDIAKSANKDANLNSVYDSARQQVNQRALGVTEVAIVAMALINVSQALLQTAGQFTQSNPQEALARMTLGLTMQGALTKVNNQMTAYNDEAARRNGSAEFDPFVRNVFNNYDDSLVLDETGQRWRSKINDDIDKLVAGGNPAMIAMQRSMNACQSGTGNTYNEHWWYGATNIVRIMGMFPSDMAQDNLMSLLEKNSNIAEWFTYVQKEAARVLADVGTSRIVPRLETLLKNPFSMGPNDALRALLKSLKENPAEQGAEPQKVALDKSAAGRDRFKVYTGQGVCDACNRPLGGVKAWIVPNDVFYASPQWRELQKNNILKLTGVKGTDADIARMQAQDHSPGSAICEHCIHMFE